MRRTFLSIAIVLILSACAAPDANKPAASADRAAAPVPTLVGAWEVTSSRSNGVGKNLLTFSSDGTFFRSGDTHTLLSGAHGAWKLVGPNRYNASYVAFAFDPSGKWVGINRTNIEVILGADGNTFAGTTKSSNNDLNDKVLRQGGAPLAGKRIQVQPF